MDQRNPGMIENLRFVLEFNDSEFIKVFYTELNENYNKIRNTKCEVVYEDIKYRNLISDCLKIINPYRVQDTYAVEESRGQTSSENVFRKYSLP